jgi:hypothetical protein
MNTSNRSFIQRNRPGPRLLVILVTSTSQDEEFLDRRSTPKARGPPLVGSQRLLIKCTSYSRLPSIHNQRTRHAVVTRDNTQNYELNCGSVCV